MFSMVYQHARQTKKIYSGGIKVLPIYGVYYVSLKIFFLSNKLFKYVYWLFYFTFNVTKHKNQICFFSKSTYSKKNPKYSYDTFSIYGTRVIIIFVHDMRNRKFISQRFHKEAFIQAAFTC